MKTRALPLLWVLLVGIFSLGLTGCATGATVAAPAKTLPEMLTSAGFKAYPAATPDQVRHLKTCPPETVMVHGRKGTAGCYAFADPKTNTMYLGDEEAYRRFRNALEAQEQKIRERQMEDDPEFWTIWGHRFGGG